MTTYQRLTAKGRGAIAVIEINGQDAVKVIDACFTPVGSRKFANKDQPLVYGHWNSTGEDLLVVTAAVDRYEIQCHGSEAAVAAIIADVSGQGAVPHRPNDPPKLLAQRLTVARFESDIRQLLATAATRRTAQHLLHQLQVAPSALAEMASQRDTNRIQTVLSYRDFGTKFHCRQSIVLCGRPNAGKSCLVNAILGFERSIVTPVAGTTRDVLTHHAVVDGWPVAISDTAGLRVGADRLNNWELGKPNCRFKTRI
jgi:tRNA modification GTPase